MQQFFQRAASVILENCHSLLPEISKMSTKTLIYHHQQRIMSLFMLINSSMSSTFNEFPVMINENQFDIITLSETWLRDNKHLLDHVKTLRYNFVYKNREQKCGGGVGAYLK